MRADHERKTGIFMTASATEYKADFAGGSSYIIPLLCVIGSQTTAERRRLA